jgi:hypothetical protein
LNKAEHKTSDDVVNIEHATLYLQVQVAPQLSRLAVLLLLLLLLTPTGEYSTNKKEALVGSALPTRSRNSAKSIGGAEGTKTQKRPLTRAGG